MAGNIPNYFAGIFTELVLDGTVAQIILFPAVLCERGLFSANKLLFSILKIQLSVKWNKSIMRMSFLKTTFRSEWKNMDLMGIFFLTVGALRTHGEWQFSAQAVQ